MGQRHPRGIQGGACALVPNPEDVNCWGSRLGIVHGQPFAPDERARNMLRQAAQLGAGMARALVYAPRDLASDALRHLAERVRGWQLEFERNGARLLDARSRLHYIGAGITPAMARTKVGAGSAYVHTVRDRNGDILDGGRTYRLTSTRTRRSRPSGPSTSMTPRPARCCRSPLPFSPPWPALPAPCRPTPTAPTTCTLARPPRRPRRQLGANAPREVLVGDLPALRATATLVRPDLETQRVRNNRLTPRRQSLATGEPERPANVCDARPAAEACLAD